jgi:hypothetical protein
MSTGGGGPLAGSAALVRFGQLLKSDLFSQ